MAQTLEISTVVYSISFTYTVKPVMIASFCGGERAIDYTRPSYGVLEKPKQQARIALGAPFILFVSRFIGVLLE
jgi:hypothetical protein